MALESFALSIQALNKTLFNLSPVLAVGVKLNSVFSVYPQNDL